MAYYLSIDRFGNEQINGGTKHAFHAHSAAPTSIPNNVQTNLGGGWNVVVNVGGTWNNTTGVWTCTKAGYYEVYGQIEWASATWGALSIIANYIIKNTAIVFGSREFTQAGKTSVHGGLPTSGVVQLAVGDTIRMATLQVTGSAKTTNQTFFTQLSIHEI